MPEPTPADLLLYCKECGTFTAAHLAPERAAELALPCEPPWPRCGHPYYPLWLGGVVPTPMGCSLLPGWQTERRERVGAKPLYAGWEAR